MTDVPEGTILHKVYMSDTLFRQLGATGVEWGEPDAEGFYNPTITTEFRPAPPHSCLAGIEPCAACDAAGFYDDGVEVTDPA